MSLLVVWLCQKVTWYTICTVNLQLQRLLSLFFLDLQKIVILIKQGIFTENNLFTQCMHVLGCNK